MLLTRGFQTELLPATFECMYITCCSQVRVPGQGEKLYGMLVIEIEQCNTSLRRELEAARENGHLMDWLRLFVHVCEWFENKVVRPDQDRLEYRSECTWLPCLV